MKQHPSYGPDPNAVYPNEAVKQVCFLKNVITRPNIQVGEYTYYDDIDGPEQFQDHVTHHYPFLGDKLIIGKFCAIARGQPPDEQRHHLPLQPHGPRMGEGNPHPGTAPL